MQKLRKHVANSKTQPRSSEEHSTFKTFLKLLIELFNKRAKLWWSKSKKATISPSVARLSSASTPINSLSSKGGHSETLSEPLMELLSWACTTPSADRPHRSPHTQSTRGSSPLPPLRAWLTFQSSLSRQSSADRAITWGKTRACQEHGYSKRPERVGNLPGGQGQSQSTAVRLWTEE